MRTCIKTREKVETVLFCIRYSVSKEQDKKCTI